MNNKLTTIGQQQQSHCHEDHEDAPEEVFSPAKVFDAQYLGEPVPQGFDAVRILIDGHLNADLSWKQETEIAQCYVDQGLRLFWEIDLGLFDALPHPLSNNTQFLSLSLSLDHFYSVLWDKFHSHSVGLCLYRGKANFSEGFPWDQEQQSNYVEWCRERLEGDSDKSLFCSNVAAEYLELLGARVPDSIPCFVLLDATSIGDPLLVAQLLSKERFSRFHIGIKGDHRLGGVFAWDQQQLSMGGIGRDDLGERTDHFPHIGVCLPAISYCHSQGLIPLHSALKWLIEKQKDFKVVPEEMLIVEWQGLDYLVVSPSTLGPQGKRKLQGFCAAGGVVVNTGSLLQLAEEISWNAFVHTHD